MQVVQTLQNSSANETAELFIVLSRQLLQHWGQSAAIHHFEEDPKSIPEVKCLEASHNHVILATHLHQSDLVHYDVSFRIIFGLDKLQSTDKSVRLALDLKHTGKSTNSNAAHNLVVLRRIILLELCFSLDHLGCFLIGWQSSFFLFLLWFILRLSIRSNSTAGCLLSCSKNGLEDSARVLGQLLLREAGHVSLHERWDAIQHCLAVGALSHSDVVLHLPLFVGQRELRRVVHIVQQSKVTGLHVKVVLSILVDSLFMELALLFFFLNDGPKGVPAHQLLSLGVKLH